jgi:2,4-didehydro-3-deoxy-L-rhamnonate hydrolase
MKLLRYGSPGFERAGAVDDEGLLRDLAHLVGDITPALLCPKGLAALRAIDLSQLPVLERSVRLGVPVNGIRQLVAVGLNYRQHAAEAHLPEPPEPVIFSKAISSLSGPNDDIQIPLESRRTDWEIELGVVIGAVARHIETSDALSYVAGYCIAHDVSERDWQLKRSDQWFNGKSFDGFGPLGPWLVTADEIPNPNGLDMELRVNGEVMQRANTSDMIFSVAQVISYVSQFMTLLPGDVLMTGTPAGVGVWARPPRFLRPGDVTTLRIERLGAQSQRFV